MVLTGAPAGKVGGLCRQLPSCLIGDRTAPSRDLYHTQSNSTISVNLFFDAAMESILWT